jgi:hypothetical protein
VALVGYTLYNQLVPAPAWPYSLFPYVTLVWLAAGAAVVVFAPRLATKIGQGLARSLGLPALGSEPRDPTPPEP